jgi:hypothetical protein
MKNGAAMTSREFRERVEAGRRAAEVVTYTPPVKKFTAYEPPAPRITSGVTEEAVNLSMDILMSRLELAAEYRSVQ